MVVARARLPPLLWVLGVLAVLLSWWGGWWLLGLVALWVAPVLLFAIPALLDWRRGPKLALALVALVVVGLAPMLPCESQPFSDAIPPQGFPPYARDWEGPLVVGASGPDWGAGGMVGKHVRCPPEVFAIGAAWMAALAATSLAVQLRARRAALTA